MPQVSSRTLSSSAARNGVLRAVAASLSPALLLLSGCGGTLLSVPNATPAPEAKAVSAGPQLGYAWKSDDQTLLPILGIAGSSLVGESVVSAGTYTAAGTSAISGIGLLVGEGGQVYRMTLPTGTPEQLGISTTSAAKFRFAPSGGAAVVYVPGAQAATLVSGLNRTIPQIRQISVASPLLDLTVSDSGTVVALLQGSPGASVALLSASGSSQTLASVGRPGGLSFVGAGEDLLVADSAANALTLIHTVSSAPSVQQIPSGGLLKSPVAVGAARSGRWAVVANSGDFNVVRIDLTGASAPQRIACPLQPTQAEPLAGNGTFRFTPVGSSPAWIADVTAANPSMLFIPALPAVSTAAGS
jgi:hypothetical protein